MADISGLVSKLASFAKAAAPLIPGGALVSGGIDLGAKIVDLVDDFTSAVPEARNSAELRAARQELINSVTAKANKTADRFDG